MTIGASFSYLSLTPTYLDSDLITYETPD